MGRLACASRQSGSGWLQKRHAVSCSSGVLNGWWQRGSVAAWQQAKPAATHWGQPQLSACLPACLPVHPVPTARTSSRPARVTCQRLCRGTGGGGAAGPLALSCHGWLDRTQHSLPPIPHPLPLTRQLRCTARGQAHRRSRRSSSPPQRHTQHGWSSICGGGSWEGQLSSTRWAGSCLVLPVLPPAAACLPPSAPYRSLPSCLPGRARLQGGGRAPRGVWVAGARPTAT